jgi:hypothetical protein
MHKPFHWNDPCPHCGGTGEVIGTKWKLVKASAASGSCLVLLPLFAGVVTALVGLRVRSRNKPA